MGHRTAVRHRINNQTPTTRIAVGAKPSEGLAFALSFFSLRSIRLRDTKNRATADSNLAVRRPTLTHLLRLEATFAATAALSICACHSW
jgi:hypothetical protein